MTSANGTARTDWIGGLAALGFAAAVFHQPGAHRRPRPGRHRSGRTRLLRRQRSPDPGSHRVLRAGHRHDLLSGAARPAGTPAGRRRAGSSAPHIALAAGAAYVGLSLAAGAAFAAPAAGVVLHLNAGTSVDPRFARAASTLGDALLLLSAPIAASVFVGAVCLAARRTRTLPGWVTGPGIAVAASLLAGAVWFPLLLLVAWTASLGTALLLHPRPTRPPQTDNAANPKAAGHASLTTRGR